MSDYSARYAPVSTASGASNGGVSSSNISQTTVKYYYKRAWRTESSGFVYWTTTVESGEYSDGGTLDPPEGVILNTWTKTM